MKTISTKSTVNIEFAINLSLSIGEARALDAIVGYGADAFLGVFYPKLGKAYLEPHEQEMRNLFRTIKDNLTFEIAKVEVAQKQIEKALSEIK